MAWDTEGTRRRIREAAAAEFAEHGPDGTTVAQIAERAGVNKERLYNYFGDKRALFHSVLGDELDKLAAGVAGAAEAAGVAGRNYEDIGEFAGRAFDYHADHPELARLLQWEGLAGGPPADEIERAKHYRAKVESVAAAQRDGLLAGDLDPGHLVFLLIALAASWHFVPQLAHLITGADGDDPGERARRREFVVRAAGRLAGAATERPAAPSPGG